jgi:CheY-like chemotaxis protein
LKVLDLTQPGASDWTIIDAFRQPGRFDGQPVIVLSASTMPKGPVDDTLMAAGLSSSN